MRDLIRDWQKWSRAERLTVLFVAAILSGFVPAALAVTIHNSSAAGFHQAADD